jgi:broad specificity phosphatase PhoE
MASSGEQKLTTRILLIRHGATTSTADDRFAGSSDVELSDEGRRQIATLSERLAGVAIAAIYCSNLRRAIDSAAIIASPHHLTPVAMPELREIDHGHWEGVPHKQVETQFADEYHRWSEDPFETIIPGGEIGRAVLERARPAVERIVAGHPNKTVAVVSHKATNRLLISAWMGSDPRRYRDRLAQDLACLNIIDFRGDRGPQLILMNDISHYHQQV